MSTFLQKIAQQIVDENPNGLLDVAVVFNNWRPSQFLTKELTALHREPFFLPSILRMDDIVSTLCKCETVPHEFLLYELYRTHVKLNETKGEPTEPFEDFLSTAEVMLSDFSEVDLYMADAQGLFDNLYELKSIGEWSIEGKPHSDFQERYLDFYHSLYTYYTELRANLSKQNKAYSGMAYRMAAEKVSESSDCIKNELKFQKIYFVGFNVTSRSESVIIKKCIEAGIGRLIVDGDAYYFENEDQEAGHFLRENRKMFGSVIGNFEHNYRDLERTINIIDCPSDLMQAKYAGQLIEQQLSNKAVDLTRNAIILADESLLLPVLNSLPATNTGINVTMGFPFEMTAIHALATKLFSLYRNARDNTFYHQDVTSVINDAFLFSLHNNNSLSKKLAQQQQAEKKVYLGWDDILRIVDSAEASLARTFKQVFMPIFETADSHPDHLLEMFHQIVMLSSKQFVLISKPTNQQTLEQEELMTFHEIVEYIRSLQNEDHFINNLPTLEKIYSRLARRHKVTFKGEPLEGLQILGMLETRNIDFDNITLLSVNEGTLPQGRSGGTLIPFTLKKAFGLPTFEEKDAIYAYHFYCMLQRARNINLLYSSDTDVSGKGEPSRFILQIERELKSCFDHININRIVVTGDKKGKTKNCDIEVAKTPEVMKKIIAKATDANQGLFPTSLTTYISCPLKYYYHNVLGIREDDDLSDDLNAAELGELVHDTLQQIYLPEEAPSPCHISINQLEQGKKEADQLVEKVMREKVLHGRQLEGRNQFLMSVAQSMVKSFLEREIKLMHDPKFRGLTMLSAEQEYRRLLDIEVGGQRHTVCFGGKMDRIDRLTLCDEKGHPLTFTRIVDYKTGKVNPSDLNADSKNLQMEGLQEKRIPEKWFQLMTYLWIYAAERTSSEAESSNLLPGIYALQNLKDNLLHATIDKHDVDDRGVDVIEPILSQLCQELLNPDIPFVANPAKNSGACNHCVANSYCPKAQLSEW